jgi:hypothetical protein
MRGKALHGGFELSLVGFIRINMVFSIETTSAALPDRGFVRSAEAQSGGEARWIGRLNLPLR